jgi:hypothetical protein
MAVHLGDMSKLLLELEAQSIIINDVTLSKNVELLQLLVFDNFKQRFLIADILDFQFLGYSYVFVRFDDLSTDL